jgi:hypothetical protein
MFFTSKGTTSLDSRQSTEETFVGIVAAVDRPAFARIAAMVSVERAR